MFQLDIFTFVHKKSAWQKKVPGSPAARLPHILQAWETDSLIAGWDFFLEGGKNNEGALCW